MLHVFIIIWDGKRSAVCGGLGQGRIRRGVEYGGGGNLQRSCQISPPPHEGAQILQVELPQAHQHLLLLASEQH